MRDTAVANDIRLRCVIQLIPALELPTSVTPVTPFLARKESPDK
jgi:hypothetical protein